MAKRKTPPKDPSAHIPAILREAGSVIRRYGLSPETGLSLLHQSENTILLVEDPARPSKLVLRVHSQQLAYHATASIASELRWMMALHREGAVEVPEVIPALDGSLVQTIAADDLDQTRHAVMFTFLEGSEPADATLVAGFERLGAVTARMHLQAMGWSPPADFIRHNWDVAAILGPHPLWGSCKEGMGVDHGVSRLLDRLSATIEGRLARLGRDRTRFGLIHADMRLANLLVEGERTKVIDFDDCGFSWFIYDLATALSFLEERPIVPELVAAWLAGYRTVATIPEDVEQEIPSVIMLRRVALLAWLGTRRHLPFAQSLGTGFTMDTCRLAEDYLRRYG